MVGTIVAALPSGYNAWGNFQIIPITVGSSYALLAEARTNSGTITYQTGVYTGSGSLSTPLTFSLGTMPLTSLASCIKYWDPTGAVLYGGPMSVIEGTSVVLHYHAGPLGVTPADIFRASIPLANITTDGWSCANQGYPVYRRVSSVDSDQVGDAFVASGPAGDWWLFATESKALENTSNIFAIPMFRADTVTSNGVKQYITKTSDPFGQPTVNATKFLGTAITTYSALCRDNIMYNNGVNNLTITAPRADNDCFFRVSNFNTTSNADSHLATVTINGSDQFGFRPAAGGSVYVLPGESVDFRVSGQGWWSLSKSYPDTTRVVIAAGAITGTLQDGVICVNKTSGAATTVNLAAGYVGEHLTVKDCKGDAATNNITVTPASGNIDGSATYVINTNYGAWLGEFMNSQWYTVSSR